MKYGSLIEWFRATPSPSSEKEVESAVLFTGLCKDEFSSDDVREMLNRASEAVGRNSTALQDKAAGGHFQMLKSIGYIEFKGQVVSSLQSRRGGIIRTYVLTDLGKRLATSRFDPGAPALHLPPPQPPRPKQKGLFDA